MIKRPTTKISLLFIFFSQWALGMGDIEISPMSITLSSDKSVTSISVKNDTDLSVILQSKVFLWTKKQGKNVYTPTQDLVVTPPITRVSVGKTQILRVGLLNQQHTHKAKYRLYITELPTQTNQQSGAYLKVVLRIGIPITVSKASKNR